jgi:3-hydroxy acid dehydrogenase / malonic semialdehyde reductase
MNKTVLITGATSGIGRACALKFARNGYRIIITGRRENILEELRKELISTCNTEVLALDFDVRIRKDVEAALKGIDPHWTKIDVLVNNAGLAAGLSPLHDGDIEDWEQMIDTNMKGLLYVSRCILPMMIKSGSGHVINIGSIAGREVYPNGNVYCATKFAVDALSKGMRMELLKHEIKVTQVLPGAAETEFSLVRFKQDKKRAKDIYNGYQPLTGDDVAEVVYYVTTLPPHVNINDITVVPSNQASAMLFNRK